jgi:hypothetical protein
LITGAKYDWWLFSITIASMELVVEDSIGEATLQGVTGRSPSEASLKRGNTKGRRVVRDYQLLCFSGSKVSHKGKSLRLT